MPVSTQVCHSPLFSSHLYCSALFQSVCCEVQSIRTIQAKDKTLHGTMFFAKLRKHPRHVFGKSSHVFARNSVANFGGAGNDSPSRYYGVIVPLHDRAVTRARWRFSRRNIEDPI